jgi:hypothetical protein
LVSWWRGEGNCLDAVGTNNGTLQNGATFAAGRVGQAFSFDGTNDYVKIPRAPGLDVGNQVTIDFWMKADPSTPIGSRTQGLVTSDFYGIEIGGVGENNVGIEFFTSTDGGVNFAHTSDPDGHGAVFPTGEWHHVAGTYDGANMQLYIDGLPWGQPRFQANPISPMLANSFVAIGSEDGRTTCGSCLQSRYFMGLIDEVDIFNRALSPSEIAAIYNAGASGKCVTLIPPFISVQPTNRTVTLGANVTFSAAAGGTPPLSYQWQLNGTNIAGATATALTLTNVQPAQAGVYALVVTNAAGSTTSSNALLTVNPPPPCTPPPSGLVSWWRGEGDCLDTAGTNNGTLQNGATFAAGRVGQALSFDGVNDYVKIPKVASLDAPSQLTIDFWMKADPSTPIGSRTQGLVTSDFYGIEIGGVGENNVGIEFFTSTDGGVNFAHTSDPNGHGAVCPAGEWHHVAGTYDGANMQLYIDGLPWGQPRFQANPISPMLANSFVAIGSEDGRTTCGSCLQSRYFMGLIDEVDIFNRALSASEIAAIYNAGAAGKCPPGVAPSIMTPPASQTVLAGATATFTVTAAGTPPLSYQWRLNGTNVAGATGTSLTLSNLQPAQAGNYAMRVTNAFGSIISSDALLTVILPPPCAPPPSGLAAWWRAEGNGNDAVGKNNGALVNGVGFTNGVVGQAFAFDGADDAVIVSNAPGLNFGSGQDFSIEAWIEPRSSTTYYGVMSIVDKRLSPVWTQDVGYEFNLGDGQLHFRMSDSLSGPSYGFGPAGPDMRDGTFHHVAVTVARNSATGGKLYVDGQMVLTFDPTVAAGNLSNTEPLRIGVNANSTFFSNFKGAIDEVSLYNRALAAAEIQAIYNAGGAGKCPPGVAPSIMTQPASQTVLAGSTATFTATAAGTPPLSYQWRLNGTNIAGATGTSLTLSNVQPAQAGNYAMRVTNAFGSILSSNALLTVVLPPPCAPPPSGLVSWWRAETNALDEVGGNNGSLHNGVGFASGEVGQAFSFNGSNSYVEVPDSPALRLTNQLTIEFWVKRQQGDWPYDYLLNKGGDWTRGALNYGVSFAPASLDSHLAFLFAGGNRHSTGIADLNWHHWAIVARNGDVDPTFYLDGVQQPITRREGASTIRLYRSTEPLRIGAQVDSISGWLYYSKAVVDEMSIYSRALSATEIQAIYLADSTGKCHQAPSILMQPASQMVTETSNVTFAVTAAGTPQLRYQWRLNGTNIAGATGTSLTLANVQASSAGSYSVRVANAFGLVISSNAVLTVNRLPVAQCADAIVSAGANCQADASVNNGSFDPDGDPITVSQSPPGPYPLGTNRVTLAVTDDKGASSSCSALVIVLDRTPPALNCPGGKVLEFQNERGTVATYSVTATDVCSTVSLVATPPSGSLFPIGLTSVHVQATDGCSNSAQCSFTVTVLGAQGVKSNVLAQLIALWSNAILTKSFAQKFDAAIQHLADSLNPAYWINQTHLQPRSGNTAMNEEELAVNKLEDIMGSRKCPVAPAVLQGFIDRIVKCDRLLATISIQDAANAGLNARRIAEALAMVAKGDHEAAAGHYANAIEHYRNAWRHVLQLRLQVSLNPDGTTRLQFMGNNNKSYLIEVSPDMVNWVSSGTCTADAEGNVEFTDPNATHQPLRFYRAVEQ